MNCSVVMNAVSKSVFCSAMIVSAWGFTLFGNIFNVTLLGWHFRLPHQADYVVVLALLMVTFLETGYNQQLCQWCGVLSCYRLQVMNLLWLLLLLGPAYLRYWLFLETFPSQRFHSRVNLFPHWVPIIVGSWWNAQHLWYLWLCSCSSLRSAPPAA